jgi:hypothetical protein
MSKINMTYMSFDHYKNLNSTDFLMLCEFIDNSISSFIKRKGGYEDLSGCKVKITLDYSNKNNKILTIEDNADGFDYDTMNDCFKIGHNKNKKPDSDLNAFGIGMKQAGFYLGKKVEITSIDHKTNSKISTKLDVNRHNLYDEVEVNVNKEKGVNFFQCLDKEQFEKGTILKISYLRPTLLTKKVVTDKIIIALQSRYYVFLNNNLDMTVNIFTNKTDKSCESFRILPKRMDYENIDSLVNNDSKKPIDKIKEEVINVIKRTCEETSKKDTKIRDDLISLIQNHKDFKWEFNEEIIDGIFVKGEIGWLKNPKGKKNEIYPLVRTYGFNLYQSGRAIYSFPSPQSNENDNQHAGTYRADLFDSELSGGNNYKRRWVGYLDMTDLINVRDEGDYKYLKPDSNKRGLKWLDANVKEKFTGKLKTFMDSYNPYLKAILNVFQDLLPKSDTSTPDKVKSKIEARLHSEYLVIEKMIRGIEGHFVLKCSDDNDITVTSKIDIESSAKDNFLQYENFIDENRTIEITLNSKNGIWHH